MSKEQATELITFAALLEDKREIQEHEIESTDTNLYHHDYQRRATRLPEEV